MLNYKDPTALFWSFMTKSVIFTMAIFSSFSFTSYAFEAWNGTRYIYSKGNFNYAIKIDLTPDGVGTLVQNEVFSKISYKNLNNSLEITPDSFSIPSFVRTNEGITSMNSKLKKLTITIPNHIVTVEEVWEVCKGEEPDHCETKKDTINVDLVLSERLMPVRLHLKANDQIVLPFSWDSVLINLNKDHTITVIDSGQGFSWKIKTWSISNETLILTLEDNSTVSFTVVASLNGIHRAIGVYKKKNLEEELIVGPFAKVNTLLTELVSESDIIGSFVSVSIGAEPTSLYPQTHSFNPNGRGRIISKYPDYDYNIGLSWSFQNGIINTLRYEDSETSLQIDSDIQIQSCVENLKNCKVFQNSSHKIIGINGNIFTMLSTVNRLGENPQKYLSVRVFEKASIRQ